MTNKGQDYKVDKHARYTAQAHAARSASHHRDPPLQLTLETLHPLGFDRINAVIICINVVILYIDAVIGLLETNDVIVSKTITALVFGTLCCEAGDWQRACAPPSQPGGWFHTRHQTTLWCGGTVISCTTLQSLRASRNVGLSQVCGGGNHYVVAMYNHCVVESRKVDIRLPEKTPMARGRST